MKLQNKKRNEVAHKNELAENYYSYADSIRQNMSFLPFTKIVHKMDELMFSKIVFFDKNNEIRVNNVAITREKLHNYLKDLPGNKPKNFFFALIKNCFLAIIFKTKLSSKV